MAYLGTEIPGQSQLWIGLKGENLGVLGSYEWTWDGADQPATYLPWPAMPGFRYSMTEQCGIIDQSTNQFDGRMCGMVMPGICEFTSDYHATIQVY